MPTTLRAKLTVPGDKSISHRAAILAALAAGKSVIRGFAPGNDCAATLRCLRLLGVNAIRDGDKLYIDSEGPRSLHEPQDILDCANSGTTMRLMAGVLASRPFMSVLTGDASLRARPMGRVVDPLRSMGVLIDGREGGTKAPLYIRGPKAGTPLFPLTGYRLPVASAQVKSCLLLASLFADGTSYIIEIAPTRDHTERLLRLLGVDLVVQETELGRVISLQGGQSLTPVDIEIPGDFSSAAFWLAAGALIPGSEVRLEKVGLNPLRTGLLSVLKRMGCDIRVSQEKDHFEPVGDIVIRGGELNGTTVEPEEVPGMVDEIPVFAVCAAAARGRSMVRGAGELRNKESDRIHAIVDNLRRMGAEAGELQDGFWVEGGRPLRGNLIQTHGDHRIAMAFAVAGLIAEGETVLDQQECIDVSYPGFLELLQRLKGGGLDT
ncbi:MAG TPA: 3-phosphoshikimate 1-carboxyvinyltransferase [Firmicutes bacterium]|nr:3-phosphoshikimate 1-carboxyvinyltransferase [Bacillota bacterium]